MKNVGDKTSKTFICVINLELGFEFLQKESKLPCKNALKIFAKMSDTEASQHSEQLELEEEEEDFTNLPLYADNDDESDISEYQLPSESENERGKLKNSKSKQIGRASCRERVF